MSDVVPVARGVSALLIVSLCLNFALAGLVVVGFVQMSQTAVRIPPGGSLAPKSLMKLVPAKRTKIEAVAEAHDARIQALQKAAMQSRRAAFASFASANFRADDFARSLEAIRTADSAYQEESLKAVAEGTAALTPAERQDVVQTVHQRKRSWWWRNVGRYF